MGNVWNHRFGGVLYYLGQIESAGVFYSFSSSSKHTETAKYTKTSLVTKTDFVGFYAYETSNIFLSLDLLN